MRSQLVGGLVGLLTTPFFILGLALARRFLGLRGYQRTHRIRLLDGLIMGGLVGGLGVAPFVGAVWLMRLNEAGWTTDRDVTFRLSAYAVGLPVTVVLIWLGRRRRNRALGRSDAP